MLQPLETLVNKPKRLSENGKTIGRPRKELSLSYQLRDWLIKHPEYGHKVIMAWLDMVLKRGNVQALDIMLDRLEGKVIERHELEGALPIMLVFQPVSRADALDVPTHVVEGESREIPELKLRN